MIAGWVSTAAAATAAGIATAIASGGITIVIAAIVAAIIYLATHWKESWDAMKSVAEIVWHFVQSVGEGIASTFRAFIGVIKGEINGLISLVNVAIRAIDSIHVTLPFGMGTIGFNIPQIPMLAEGGIVTKPTLAMIGEAGSEAVIPLSKMGGMGGGMNITINVAGSVVQEQDLAISVRDQIAILMRRRGLNPSILGV